MTPPRRVTCDPDPPPELAPEDRRRVLAGDLCDALRAEMAEGVPVSGDELAPDEKPYLTEAGDLVVVMPRGGLSGSYG